MIFNTQTIPYKKTKKYISRKNKEIRKTIKYIRNKRELRGFFIQEFVKCFYDNIKTIWKLRKVSFYQLIYAYN